MKLRAVCVCRNEVDVIVETLLHARDFCDEIFVYDMCSDDGTVERVREIEGNTIKLFDSVRLPFHDGRHADVWRSLWRERPADFSPDDWYMILDADEQIVRDPRPILFSREYRRVNLQRTWQINHYYTRGDHERWLGGDRRPVAERMRWFNLNNVSPRFFRCSPPDPWPNEPSGAVPFGRIVPLGCRYEGHRVVLNRHFQYRSPDQMRRRFETRADNQSIQGIFAPQWTNRTLEMMIRPESECRYWDDEKSLANLSSRQLVRIARWSARARVATTAKRALDSLRTSNPYD